MASILEAFGLEVFGALQALGTSMPWLRGEAVPIQYLSEYYFFLVPFIILCPGQAGEIGIRNVWC